TITVNPNPVINFSGDNLIGCVPMPVNFTNSSTPSGTNCSWDFGDGTTDNTCGATSHTYTASGCYDVTLTVEENGCSSTSTVQQMICLYDQAVADFSLSPSQVDIEDTEVSFTNESVFAT